MEERESWEERMRAQVKLSEDDGAEAGREKRGGEKAASGPAYANPP